MAVELDYYRLLNRIQHPVFSKDFSGVPDADASFHLIRNYLLARQLVKLKTLVNALEQNAFPNSVNEDGATRWENDYFGFTKPSLSIGQRRLELLKWINSSVGMAKPDVINLSIAITGKTPSVILNVSKGGWKLGKASLGVGTILAGADTTANRYTYLVKFNEIVNTALLKTLDKELTRIEKAGSKHIISAHKVKWILGKSALGVDTYLRNS